MLDVGLIGVRGSLLDVVVPDVNAFSRRVVSCPPFACTFIPRDTVASLLPLLLDVPVDLGWQPRPPELAAGVNISGGSSSLAVKWRRPAATGYRWSCSRDLLPRVFERVGSAATRKKKSRRGCPPRYDQLLRWWRCAAKNRWRR